MTDAIAISIRRALPTDFEFIFSNWLRGARFGNSIPKECNQMPSFYERVPSDLFFSEYTKIIQSILDLPGIQIDVASDSQNPLWTAGFSVFREPVLYWVFVKNDFRGRGIARLLLDRKKITTAFSTTKPGYAISQKKGWVFNPFLLGGEHGSS